MEEKTAGVKGEIESPAGKNWVDRDRMDSVVSEKYDTLNS